jgi:hypothetical protein
MGNRLSRTARGPMLVCHAASYKLLCQLEHECTATRDTVLLYYWEIKNYYQWILPDFSFGDFSGSPASR